MEAYQKPYPLRASSAELRRLFVRYRDNEVSYEQIVTAAMPVMRRIVRAATFKYGIRDECGDDVLQSLVAELPKIAEVYNPDYALEPLLIRVADRMAYRERNRTWRKREISAHYAYGKDVWESEVRNVNDDEKAISVIVLRDQGDTFEQDLIDELDRSKALAIISKRLDELTQKALSQTCDGSASAMNAVPQQKTELFDRDTMPGFEAIDAPISVPNLLGLKEKVVRTRELGKDQVRLAEIRNLLEMTQGQFAKHLGIKVPCLAANEYGRTRKVSKKIMKAAEDLERRLGPMVTDLKARYSSPMCEILVGWCETINVDPEDTRTIAQVLGVTETTVRRWRNNNALPNVHALREYEDIVEDFAVTGIIGKRTAKKK